MNKGLSYLILCNMPWRIIKTKTLSIMNGNKWVRRLACQGCRQFCDSVKRCMTNAVLVINFKIPQGVKILTSCDTQCIRSVQDLPQKLKFVNVLIYNKKVFPKQMDCWSVLFVMQKCNKHKCFSWCFPQYEISDCHRPKLL